MGIPPYSHGLSGGPLLYRQHHAPFYKPCGKASTRQLLIHSIPIAVSGSGHTRKQINKFEVLSSDMQESTHKVKKPASQVVLSRVQTTVRATRRTPYGASCLVHAMSAWSVETRRAPPRHCMDARVNGLKTTATQGKSTPPRIQTPITICNPPPPF